ncbi:sugar transferase [Mogibacterium timidum]|uniref:sugar transferase n=1 Tax=Mogibacterium timidum TaxID=35519 RepID=UPI0028D1B112|nr:sugar transferase [Mogibacterium timidum]
MVLCKWNDLPEHMRCDEVKEYYDILNSRKGSLIAKRIFDFVISLLMTIILSPILLILIILIKIDDPGPAFFRQVRATTNGREFRIFKFRTMVVNAEKLGAQVTQENDPRVTKIGHKLRRYRLDELPQLLNVITGDMSFVGTRPEVPRYVACYSNEMLATLLLPAGVTSEASITYKDENELIGCAENPDEIYVERVLPEKMKYNLDALRNFSFVGEIKTMLKTVGAVIR